MKAAGLLAVLLAAAAPARAASARAEAALSAAGVALSEDEDGLRAAAVWPDGPAAGADLRPGDRVWGVDRAAPLTAVDAAAAVDATAPEIRLSFVVRRGLETSAPTGPAAPAPSDFIRGASDLSGREKSLAAARSARDREAARDAVAEAAPLDWTLRAGQAFWARFPGGLPTRLAPGDVVAADTATGLTTDGSLDYLAVPPGSRAWARVLAFSDDGSSKTARLAFFKMSLAGGRTYPIRGAADALAEVPADLARANADGTVVVASPPPAAGGKTRSGKDLLFDETARIRVRLADPVVLCEAPGWWRAGPGFWFKTALDAAGRRRFQVTRVIAGRSAAAAGLKVGDFLDGVAGRSAERLDFDAAIDALYAAPGTSVKVSVVRDGSSRELALTRGVAAGGNDATARLPLPFEER